MMTNADGNVIIPKWAWRGITAIAAIVLVAFISAFVAWCAYMTRGQQTNAADLAVLKQTMVNQEANLGRLQKSYQGLVEQLLKNRQGGP